MKYQQFIQSWHTIIQCNIKHVSFFSLFLSLMLWLLLNNFLSFLKHQHCHSTDFVKIPNSFQNKTQDTKQVCRRNKGQNWLRGEGQRPESAFPSLVGTLFCNMNLQEFCSLTQQYPHLLDVPKSSYHYSPPQTT